MGYWNISVASEKTQGNLMPGEYPNINILPESINDDEDWKFDGATGGEFAQRVGVKCRLQ